MAEPGPRRSMRRQLLLILLGSVTVIWVATAIVSYLDARHEIDELLDAHLAQSASLLIAQAGREPEELEEHAPELHRYARRVAFQFWEGGTLLRLHSGNAPATRLSPRDEGFSDARIDGERWRVFSGWDRKRRYLVQVGERMGARGEIAATMARNMLLPLAVALPVLALLVWLTIERVMRPLRMLDRQVEHRAPDNLAALELGDAPAEVAPLVLNLNRLFERVRTSLENERRFTADAAHELRTPLAALRAQAQVARGATEDRERAHALDSVIAGCDRATHLVEQLLTLARLEAAAWPERLAACDLAAVARTVLADLAQTAHSRGVAIALDAPERVLVRGDAALLHVLVRNLADNALRYGASGGQVRVVVEGGAAGASLRVEDQGPGIPREARARVLDRFHRELGSGESGAGLGLAIAARVAALHGAALALEEGAGGRGLSARVAFPACSGAS